MSELRDKFALLWLSGLIPDGLSETKEGLREIIACINLRRDVVEVIDQVFSCTLFGLFPVMMAQNLRPIRSKLIKEHLSRVEIEAYMLEIVKVINPDVITVTSLEDMRTKIQDAMTMPTLSWHSTPIEQVLGRVNRRHSDATSTEPQTASDVPTIEDAPPS